MTQDTTIKTAYQDASLIPANELAINKSTYGTNKVCLQQLNIQYKLVVSTTNDFLEDEADSMADKVMRIPLNDQPFFSPKLLSVSHIQHKCADCEE